MTAPSRGLLNGLGPSAAALLFGGAVLLGGSCDRDQQGCQVCQRMECGNLTFTIRLQDGSEVHTCCPRCGLHYIGQEHPPVAALRVRDFDTSRPINARQAYYVEGSDVAPCTAMGAGAPKDERGCCLRAVYDRCLPSLLAFASESSAENFAREHGGAVKTLEGIRIPGT